MPISFPTSPANGDTHVIGSITYQYDSTDDKWIGLGVTPADRLVEGSNSLEINANNDLVWSGDSVLLGTATANVNDRLTIHDPGSAFMSIRSDVASDGNSQILDFGVGTADRSSANLTAVIAADIHSTSGGTLKADLVFQTNAGNNISDKLRLTSDGQLLINHDTNVAPDGYESKLQLADDSYQGSSTVWKRAAGSSAGANPALVMQKVRGSDINGQGAVVDSDSIGQVRFYGADGTTAIECANISSSVDNTVSTNNVPGKLIFKTAKLLAGQGSPVYPTQAMTIKANHNVEIHDGNLVFETAGTGINFSAQPAAGSGTMQTEVLDSYEEGTWTPTINKAGVTGSVTGPTDVFGYYRKVGGLLFLSFYFYKDSGTFGNNTNRWYVGNLPFNVVSSSSGAYNFITGGYMGLNGTNYNFDSNIPSNGGPAGARWQANNANGTNTLSLYGSLGTINWTSGALEFSGCGVVMVD